MLIHQIFDHIQDFDTNKKCLIYGKIQLTYGEFIQNVDELAYQLGTHIKKGDKILVKLVNPVSQLLYFFGILKVGGACVFIDSSTSEEVCIELMERHNINLYIDENFQLSTEVVSEFPKINQEDLFLGALSSGSTGTPKLIWRDHQSWSRGFPIQSKTFTISGLDTLYLVSSLVYTANLNACLHVFSEGGTVVMASHSLPRTWLKDMMNHDISAIFMVPANYRILLKVMKSSLPQVTSIVTAGAKIDQETVQKLVEKFPQAKIYEYYGASELGHVSYSTAEDLLLNPESVGKAFPGVILTIEDDCIWAQSPYLAPDYRPKATVGDLGRIDADGYLYLLGRKQGLINAGGIKVIPEQVEKVLLQCPGIADVVVGGIDDSIRGQKVCAWIVKKSKTLMSGDIIEFCRRKMRPHYCPSKIIFIDEIPLNKSGKIDRMGLKRQLQ
ncbi:class I adenylate-forming enzyme family protein [Pelosinus sp. sgz500959]|uniref:class I adenylate-forming enzyme family protein n=1 Tax=Pelosinus sp. sgz500959 TaxID=3242472 RepID=UPI00366F508D